MAHFAELNENNEVINVIVVNTEDCLDENGIEIEEVGINYLLKHHGEGRIWKKTSYNNNIRCRYAYIGGTYDQDLDVFLYPKPFPSWILNLENYLWRPPVSEPELTEEQIINRQEYIWNEDIVNWQLTDSNI
jgi:hypothetical protein